MRREIPDASVCLTFHSCSLSNLVAIRESLGINVLPRIVVVLDVLIFVMLVSRFTLFNAHLRSECSRCSILRSVYLSVVARGRSLA